ncbi:MAG: polyprenyl synthetase family protein [Pseudomonadota bacterium]
MSFESAIPQYIARVDAALASELPDATVVPHRLHQAMHYATLNGGKRIRPLLVYATGEVLDIPPEHLDAPAVAVELIHAFSLVHDDLPAMDDDDLRRGRPTVHRQFDEATAILAADALQPLAFEVLARSGSDALARAQLDMVRILAFACGSLGMTGGQAIDIESEGQQISGELLQKMFEQKTGALIEAAVKMAAALDLSLTDERRAALAQFAHKLGLAFQIRDDILDIEGDTETIGKPAGSDLANDKATWPAVHGLQAAKAQCEALYEQGISALEIFGARQEPLAVLARRIVWRED